MTFAPIKRGEFPILVGFAGGTGSGKTYTGLLFSRGVANGHPFAAIDTENGRMSHYADLFPEVHVDRLTAPFRPDAYTAKMDEAIAYLERLGVPRENRVVLIDSMSHEWSGDGGCLDWQEDEMGGVEAKRASSWIKPKRAHKKMMTHLTQLPAHAVLCFRAEEKVEFVKQDGKMTVVPKRTLPGGSLDGWVFLSEKNVPYELTASFLLMADAPGVPRPIKLQEQHKQFVPLDRPLDESVGRQLAAWAQGSVGEPQADIPDAPHGGAVPVSQSGEEAASPTEILTLSAELIGASSRPDATAKFIQAHATAHDAATHHFWLREQHAKLVAK